MVDPLRFEGRRAQQLVGVARSPSRRARYAATLDASASIIIVDVGNG